MKLAVLICFAFNVFSSGHVVKRQTINDVFQDVVRQKTRGNSIQQCPCVIHPDSQQCISYDSRYIAVNYEEAILSFLDLSKHSINPAPLINFNTFSCRTQECRQCFSLLYFKLEDVGFIPSSYRSSIPLLPRNQLNPDLCSRFNFAKPVIASVPPAVVPSYIQDLITAGQMFRRSITAQSRSRSRGSPPAAFPNIPQNNRNNNNNNNNRINSFPNNQNSNQNPNLTQSFRNQQGVQGQRNSNQNNQLQNPNTQFRNNQAMRNRFNAQQRANNMRSNFQRPFQQSHIFQQRPWQGQREQSQQQRFQQLQFQNPRAFQNINGLHHQWNGRFWEPTGRAVAEIISSPVQQSVINGWTNGWQNGNGQQISGGGVGLQLPIQTAPASATLFPQPLPWTGVNGGFGGNNGFGGSWGGVGSGGNQNNHNLLGLFGGLKNRQKRANTPAVIGQRFTINCMQRGDSEDDMLSLCGSCWTWRQLPENYFPRIINELSCKPDDFCLSGWGECVQQYRNVDVLRRDNGRWVATVITTSTCCDCRVRAGTEIHSLVISDKH